MKTFSCFMSMLILLCIAKLSLASTDIESAIKTADKIRLAQGADLELKVTALPESPEETALTDPETKKSYLRAMQEYYNYRSDGYTYRGRVFEWQLLSSRIIFVVVLILVSSGLYFSAIQFRLAMNASKEPTIDGESNTDPNSGLNTRLEISPKGVVVSSSVLGVIVLSLSLAFFYLYLIYVYPIKDVL